MEGRKQDPELCEVPRWQMIKASLNNLNFSDFVAKAEADPRSVMIDVRTQAEHDSDSIPTSTVLNYLARQITVQVVQDRGSRDGVRVMFRLGSDINHH